jgi:hypothetical protein
VQAQPLSLDEKYKKLEEKLQRVATNTISYTRKQANKEWFDEDCTEVNEEKNAARERAIQIKTRGAENAYKLARKRERRLFRKRLNELNDGRRPFEPQVDMCGAKNGELFTNKNQVLARLKQNFEEHLNEGSESEQPTRPVDLRDDGVDIDLPSREKIAGLLKYLKKYNSDSIVKKRWTQSGGCIT